MSATFSTCRKTEASMSRPETKRAIRAFAAAVAFGTLLAGCSDIYFDRRETIALGAEDAVASNMVGQMVDPWPRHSNNNNLACNGALHPQGQGHPAGRSQSGDTIGRLGDL